MRMLPAEYTPDRWVILKFKSPVDTVYKVLGGWSGGYTHGDSWKISSGITYVIKKEDKLILPQHSGSLYNLFYTRQGLSMMTAGILNSLTEQAKERPDVGVELLEVEKFLKEFLTTTT
jgi:hypothetical protein